MREITPRFGKTKTTDVLTGLVPLKRTIPVFDDIANYFTMAHLQSGHRTLSHASNRWFDKSLEAKKPFARDFYYKGSVALGHLAERPLAAEILGLTKQLAIAGITSAAAWTLYQMIPGNIPSAQ